MVSDEHESAPDSEESELPDETEDVGDTEDAEDKGEWVEKWVENGPEVKKDVDEREEEVAWRKLQEFSFDVLKPERYYCQGSPTESTSVHDTEPPQQSPSVPSAMSFPDSQKRKRETTTEGIRHMFGNYTELATDCDLIDEIVITTAIITEMDRALNTPEAQRIFLLSEEILENNEGCSLPFFFLIRSL
ncbi:hypothetical protein PEX2_038070 [Penicillium expansum]|uniref:Uncharacterized protein n=1 Tax=Penicillium expansum TaxID=27334 RepID=A0A0A2JG14_PENEN|nr:hypothetical protein PEX2_038070 [Penicillium expansum]KGO54319.1 hypothetical protein PEX2_038070 [Penicillium expansum]